MKKFIMLALLMTAYNVAQAQVTLPWAQQMSGEQVMTLPGGKTMTSKIYVDNGKVRIDANVEGMQMSNIVLQDKKIMYNIMPAQKIVMEIPVNPKESAQPMAFGAENVKFEPMGTATLDGVECEKYKLLVNGGGKPQLFWINKQSKLPVQMEAEDGAIKIAWRNVVAGPQAAALFEPPADYRKMKMPVQP